MPVRALPRSLCRPVMVGIALILGATACVGSDATHIAAPTPERADVTLLPPAAADGEREPQPSAVSEVDAVELAATATPGPSLAPLNCLSLRSQIAQLLVPLANQSDLSTAIALASAGDLGGVGLLGEPDEQLSSLLTELQQSSFVPVMVASDEEGGTVQRLANLLGPMPAARVSATTASPEEVRAAWLEYGSRVKALGIGVIFGPVVDVGSGPGIGSRSFGDDPAVVTIYAAAVAEGLIEAGVMPVFKHFPGHGRSSGDSHLGLPITPSLDELRRSDLVPYVELVGGSQSDGVGVDRVGVGGVGVDGVGVDGVGVDGVGVMVGHLSVPGLTTERPTSLSPETINGLLKTEIGFGGLVFTDALNMGAIADGFGTVEAVGLAFAAGADLAILGSLSDVGPVLDHLVERAEADPGFAALLESRTRRVLAAKQQSDLCRGAR